MANLTMRTVGTTVSTVASHASNPIPSIGIDANTALNPLHSMPKLCIEFETNNAAFADNLLDETSRILRLVADEVDEYGVYTSMVIKDINGNTIGQWSFE